METPDRSQAKSWEGKDVVDRDGQRLGRCVGVFADTATGVPEWLHVEVEGHVRSFVPAIESSETDGTVRVRFARDAVVAAPAVGDDDELSKAEELELYRHYGVPVEADEGSVLPADDATVPAGAAAPAPVAGTSDRVSTGASTTSGAETPPAGTAGLDPEREQDRLADTTALADATPLADADTVEGAGVTPETGDQLPVLDPAAASTPVPEDQVTYVEPSGPDLPGTAGDTSPPVSPPESEQPRPTLRRVPAASPPPAAPPSGSSDLSALTPLGAVAGVAAAVALVLRARDRRARRRDSAAARAGRLGSSLRAGSTVALASASGALAGVPDAADRTRRSAALASKKASKAAAKRQQRAAAAARRQRRQTAAALAVAAKAAAEQKKAAASSLQSASTSASKSVERQRKAAKAALTAGTSRGSSKTSAVTAAPAKVAERGRKVRRSLARKLWNAVVLSSAGGGYVLGAKAGRQRYDELSQVASAVAGSPKVQSATEAVTDPERRSDLLAEVQQQAGSLVGRRGEPRS